MDKNIEHYFFKKENFLSGEYCESCINELNKHSWEKHQWYQTNDDLYHKPQGDHEPEVIGIERFSKNVQKINAFIVKELYSTILEYVSSFDFDWFAAWKGYSAKKFIR